MGAQTQLHLCYVSKEKFENGEYYSDCRIKKKVAIIKKFDLNKTINKLTIDAILKSDCYSNFRDEPEFKEYLDYFNKLC